MTERDAERIELPGGLYLDADNEIHVAADHEHLADVRFYPHCREIFAAAIRQEPSADYAGLMDDYGLAVVRSSNAVLCALEAARLKAAPAPAQASPGDALRECPSCQGNGGEIDTTYDRTGAWSSCRRCCGTGLIYSGPPSEKARAALNQTGDA